MKIMLLVLLALTSACALTPTSPKTTTELQDLQGRSEAQHVVDGKSCERYSGVTNLGRLIIDSEYYLACMELKGYKTVTKVWEQ